MARHLILAGGGHAHLYTLRRLHTLTDQGIAVTLVTPDRYHYYSGMAPGMLGGLYRPEEIRIDVQSLAERGGGRCLIAAAAGLDPLARRLHLSDGCSLAYDVLSLNIGSVVAPGQMPTESIIPVKPIENLVRAHRKLLELTRTPAPRILIVGGGAAGIELAGNIRRILSDRGVITLVSATPILPLLPVSVRETVRQLLGRRAITLIEGITVTGWDGATALLEDGTRVPCDLALLATGVQPPPVLRRFGLPVADDGSLRVNRYLQSVGAPEVFGGGDCVTLTDHPLARVGVYAVRQGPILYRNLAAVLTGGTLVPFIPQRHFLQILNLGDGTALLTRNGFVWRSRLALWLKSYIDRKFVAEYRLS